MSRVKETARQRSIVRISDVGDSYIESPRAGGLRSTTVQAVLVATQSHLRAVVRSARGTVRTYIM